MDEYEGLDDNDQFWTPAQPAAGVQRWPIYGRENMVRRLQYKVRKAGSKGRKEQLRRQMQRVSRNK